jgi:hypothetical protein
MQTTELFSKAKNIILAVKDEVKKNPKAAAEVGIGLVLIATGAIAGLKINSEYFILLWPGVPLWVRGMLAWASAKYEKINKDVQFQAEKKQMLENGLRPPKSPDDIIDGQLNDPKS